MILQVDVLSGEVSIVDQQTWDDWLETEQLNDYGQYKSLKHRDGDYILISLDD